jgi:predicted acetyltransferase
MQFYMYDFSEYTGTDVGPDGFFGGYPFLEEYWKEESNKFPYIIKKDEKYIGFVFVRILDEGGMKYFSIAEFFIMRKYRRKGFGALVAEQVFNLHRGRWEVYQMEANRSAQVFWRKVILEYTKGQFKEKTENGRIIQSFIN